MRPRRRVLWLAAVTCLATGCVQEGNVPTTEGAPPPTGGSPAAPVAAASTTIPDTVLTFRGLVAFDLRDGKAVFVDPDPQKTPLGHAHPAAMAFNLAKLAYGSGTPADAVATLSDGTVIGIWEFAKLDLDATNVGNNDGNDKLEFIEVPVKGQAPEMLPPPPPPNPTPAGYNLVARSVRWLPQMVDIFGLGADDAKPDLDKDKVKEAKKDKKIAEGSFPEGQLLPVFDRDVHRTTRYDVGYRKCTAVADALRLTVKVRDKTKPTLVLTPKGGKATPFVIEPGTFIELAAMPLKKGGDFAHMGHVFALRKGGKDDRPVTLCVESELSGGLPIRCAPITFP